MKKWISGKLLVLDLRKWAACKNSFIFGNIPIFIFLKLKQLDLGSSVLANRRFHCNTVLGLKTTPPSETCRNLSAAENRSSSQHQQKFHPLSLSNPIRPQSASICSEIASSVNSCEYPTPVIGSVQIQKVPLWKIEPPILRKMHMKIGSFLQGSGHRNDGNATTTKLVKHEKTLQSQAQKD